jgi:hypothetical protein
MCGDKVDGGMCGDKPVLPSQMSTCDAVRE